MTRDGGSAGPVVFRLAGGKPVDRGGVPRSVGAAPQRAEGDPFGVEVHRSARRERIAIELQIGGDLPRQGLDVARAVHADGGATVGDLGQGRKYATLVVRGFGGLGIVRIERHMIEALAENEDVGDDVAAAAGARQVVAAGARVRVRRRNAIEVAREDQRIRRIRERFAGALGQWPAAALLAGPDGGEELLAVSEQLLARDGVLLAVLEVTGDRHFASDFDGSQGRGQEEARGGRPHEFSLLHELLL